MLHVASAVWKDRGILDVLVCQGLNVCQSCASFASARVRAVAGAARGRAAGFGLEQASR